MSRKYARDDQLCRVRKIEEKCLKLYADIDSGYEGQGERADATLDFWDAYNCKLGQQQYYNGISQIFVPIIHNAVEARQTRFTNQVFPKGGRYVEVIGANGEEPHAWTALMEHYVRRAQLRTKVVPPLCRNGDVEGQYNLYCFWNRRARHVTWKEKVPVKVGGQEIPAELEEGVEEIKSDVIIDEYPDVEVIPDADVLILPQTAASPEEAFELGGSATIIRRYTKAQLQEMVDEGEIDEDRGEFLIEEMGKPDSERTRNTAKHHIDAAGISAKGKYALCYETWTKLKVGQERRLCKVIFGGPDLLLSVKLNPYWSDFCPLISSSPVKEAGAMKGVSAVKPCMKMQIAANDAVNEGMDSANFALLPIVMTDPLKNPKIGTMIFDLAAVWETSPNDTRITQFPPLWQQAFEIVAACKQEIFQTLSVNPAMLPQSTGLRSKRNQAEIAMEQQVDVLTTADAVTVLEESVLTPVLERFAAMDAQFRQTDITVKAYGHMGLRASMEVVPPLQLGKEIEFRWFGVEQARNAAQIQQQIALMNVLRGIPPQMLPGRRINLVPAVEHAISSAFGPRIAPLVFEDMTKAYTYPPEFENEILAEGHMWPVSPLDNDAEHIQEHINGPNGYKETGDIHGTERQHIAMHRAAQIQKAMAQQPPGGQPGTPGGAGSGIAGVPRAGGQVAGPRQIKQPPGAIAPEAMPRAGAVVMPRKY